MKLSTRGTYGLRAICYIAEKKTTAPIPLSVIAKELNLSENYLEQLVRLLKKAALLESVRGAQGGYRLARSADRISVGEVLRVLEGEIQPDHCTPQGQCPHVGGDICHAHIVLRRIHKSIDAAIDGLTLADLIFGDNED